MARLVPLFFLCFISTPLWAESPAPQPHLGQTGGRRIRELLERKLHTVKGSDFLIDVRPDCLDEKREDLRNRLNKLEEVPFNELTDALVELHLKHKGPKSRLTMADMERLLGKIRNNVSRTDLHQMKVDYEALLQKHFNKAPVYNAKAHAIAEICDSNRMQCYSGTVLNQVITRYVLSRDGFIEKNPVIIYEEGHVLPGYMVKENGDWRLIGIETTGEGPAKIDYGLTKDLTRPIRVVDAEHWILVELFKDCLVDGSKIAQDLMNKTATKYGLPARLATATAATGIAGVGATSGEMALNSSPFGFGVPKSPEGDIARVKMDSVKRSDLGANPNRTEIEGKRLPQPTPTPEPKLERRGQIFEVTDHHVRRMIEEQLSSHNFENIQVLIERYRPDPNMVIDVPDLGYVYEGRGRYPLALYLLMAGRRDSVLMLMSDKRFDPNQTSERKDLSIAMLAFSTYDILAEGRDKKNYAVDPVASAAEVLKVAEKLSERKDVSFDFDGKDEPILVGLACQEQMVAAFLKLKPDLTKRAADKIIEGKAPAHGEILLSGLQTKRYKLIEPDAETRKMPAAVLEKARASCERAVGLVQKYLGVLR